MVCVNVSDLGLIDSASVAQNFIASRFEEFHLDRDETSLFLPDIEHSTELNTLSTMVYTGIGTGFTANVEIFEGYQRHTKLALHFEGSVVRSEHNGRNGLCSYCFTNLGFDTEEEPGLSSQLWNIIPRTTPAGSVCLSQYTQFR